MTFNLFDCVRDRKTGGPYWIYKLNRENGHAELIGLHDSQSVYLSDLQPANGTMNERVIRWLQKFGYKGRFCAAEFPDALGTICGMPEGAKVHTPCTKANTGADSCHTFVPEELCIHPVTVSDETPAGICFKPRGHQWHTDGGNNVPGAWDHPFMSEMDCPHEAWEERGGAKICSEPGCRKYLGPVEKQLEVVPCDERTPWVGIQYDNGKLVKYNVPEPVVQEVLWLRIQVENLTSAKASVERENDHYREIMRRHGLI